MFVLQEEQYNQLYLLLKTNFPIGSLVLDDIFDIDSCYISNKQQIAAIVDLIQGRTWNAIDWQLIYASLNQSDELVVPSCLTTEAYTILFPSFLLDCLLNLKGERNHASYLLFIDWHLNLNNLKYNDHYEEKSAFLLGLSNDQKKCIASILSFMTSFEVCGSIAKEALDAYWIDFL